MEFTQYDKALLQYQSIIRNLLKNDCSMNIKNKVYDKIQKKSQRNKTCAKPKDSPSDLLNVYWRNIYIRNHIIKIIWASCQII